ncbi:MAG TPA: glycoside hydrolase family 3 N-terminal domain-containing protein, partial [Bacteroidales bacterium]|nr:glycoside hydrolase family 3 N-terminal domain-containing protein [Bacteroidales bacterium]
MKTIRILILILILSPVLQAQTYLDPDAPVEERVEDLLSRMTLEEKVGQMVQAERGSISGALQHIEEFYIGSVLSGGGSVPSPNNTASWVEMYNNMQSRAMSTRLGIPLIYGIDAVHGHNNLKDAVIFPHNIGLGCTRNPELVRQCAEITATEVRATGINWTFSPCITVPQNELWGRTYEGFGELTSLVDTLGRATVLGYQS